MALYLEQSELLRHECGVLIMNETRYELVITQVGKQFGRLAFPGNFTRDQAVECSVLLRSMIIRPGDDAGEWAFTLVRVEHEEIIEDVEL